MALFDELRQDASSLSRWQQHKFVLLIAGVLIISCVLISIAMQLYVTSGASQVDISTPGMQSVREQASEEAKKSANDAFPSNGKLDKKSLSEFDESYRKHVEQISPSNHFTPDAVSPENLQLFVDSTGAAQ